MLCLRGHLPLSKLLSLRWHLDVMTGEANVLSCPWACTLGFCWFQCVLWLVSGCLEGNAFSPSVLCPLLPCFSIIFGSDRRENQPSWTPASSLCQWMWASFKSFIQLIDLGQGSSLNPKWGPLCPKGTATVLGLLIHLRHTRTGDRLWKQSPSWAFLSINLWTVPKWVVK